MRTWRVCTLSPNYSIQEQFCIPQQSIFCKMFTEHVFHVYVIFISEKPFLNINHWLSWASSDCSDWQTYA